MQMYALFLVNSFSISFSIEIVIAKMEYMGKVNIIHVINLTVMSIFQENPYTLKMYHLLSNAISVKVT